MIFVYYDARRQEDEYICYISPAPLPHAQGNGTRSLRVYKSQGGRSSSDSTTIM